MKRLIILLVIVAAIVYAYFAFFKKKDDQPKQPKVDPIAVKTHSAAFNTAVDKAVTDYLSIKNAFVDADTTLAKAGARALIASLDSIPLAELDKDKVAVSATAKASIEDIKSNALSLLMQTDLTEMRKDFNMVTQMMYPSFFQAVNYEGEKLYLEHCPMAFDNDQGADWLSNSSEIVNPYLGKNHPKYKGTMLGCGEVKDSVFAK